MPRVEKEATLSRMTVAAAAQLLWTAMKKRGEIKPKRTTTTVRKKRSLKPNTWSVIAT
jgi:hypothetical protein